MPALSLTFLLSALVLLGSNAAKGVVGFGGPLVAIPILSLWMAPADATMLSVLTDLLTGTWLGVEAWRKVSVRLALIVLGPLLCGQYLGTELLASLPVDVVRKILATLIGLFALSLLAWPVQRSPPESDEATARPAVRRLAALAGFLGGVISGLVGPASPPILAWTRRYMTQAGGRTLMLAIFLPTSAWLVLLLMGKGLASPPVFWTALWLSPAAVAGAFLGRSRAGKLAPEVSGRLVGTVLLLAAIGLASR